MTDTYKSCVITGGEYQPVTNTIMEERAMFNIFYKDDEGVETECPDCGSDAIVNDSGLVCSNPDCPNS